MQLSATLSKEDIDEAIGDWLRKKIPQAQEVNLKTTGSGKNFSASAEFTMNDACSAVLETAPQPEVKEEVLTSKQEEIPPKKETSKSLFPDKGEEELLEEPKKEESAPSQETNADVQQTAESPSKPAPRKKKQLFKDVKTS